MDLILQLIEELQLKYGLSRYQSSYAMAVAQTQKEAWSEAIQTLTLAQEIVNEAHTGVEVPRP